MSATPAPAAPQVAEMAGPSAWDQVKTGASNSVNWLGRQISWIGSTIKDFAIKTYEWAKPAFQAVAKFFAEKFDQVKEIVMQNREMAAAIAVTALVSTLVTLGICHLCGSGETAPSEQ